MTQHLIANNGRFPPSPSSPTRPTGNVSGKEMEKEVARGKWVNSKKNMFCVLNVNWCMYPMLVDWYGMWLMCWLNLLYIICVLSCSFVCFGLCSVVVLGGRGQTTFNHISGGSVTPGDTCRSIRALKPCWERPLKLRPHRRYFRMMIFNIEALLVDIDLLHWNIIHTLMMAIAKWLKFLWLSEKYNIWK